MTEPISKNATTASRFMVDEANAILKASERLSNEVDAAVELILNCTGKVVVTGVGKSGQIGSKIAATLRSTGTESVFLHPTDAIHGDLGVYSSRDITLILSKSGCTRELLELCNTELVGSLPKIAILGNCKSPLARCASVVLDASVSCEIDHLGLVPTASAIVAMAVGDALACTVMKLREFTNNQYVKSHPAGQTGRRARATVAGFMHELKDIAAVSPDSTMREVLLAMNDRPLGAACVLDQYQRLVGLITDGDIRRFLTRGHAIYETLAGMVMCSNPVSVVETATLQFAIQLMENRTSQISVLPVCDEKNQKCVGLLRLHDVYQSELS